MNGMLWFVQVVLAVFFAAIGIMKVRGTKDQLLLRLKWVEDFSPGTLHFIGVVEILGAIGLVLPAVKGVPGWLVVPASIALALVMIGAIFTHLRRKESQSLLVTVAVLGLTIFVVFGRLAVPLAR